MSNKYCSNCGAQWCAFKNMKDAPADECNDWTPTPTAQDIMSVLEDDGLAADVVCDYPTETHGEVAIAAYRAAVLERVREKPKGGMNAYRD